MTVGPNGPFVGQLSVPVGTPAVNVQFVAVSVLLGEIPPLALATHSVEAVLMGSLLGVGVRVIVQFGVKKMPQPVRTTVFWSKP